MVYALITNNVVVSVQALAADVAQALRAHYTVMDITNVSPSPQIGWTLSGGVLSGPPPVVSWHITRLAMRLRLQVPELLGIFAMAASGTQNGMIVKMIMDNNSLAEYVDLQSPLTAQAVGTLAAFGLITSERATEILTTPPTLNELWKAP